MMDFLPTFAGLSGADLPANRKLDGENIWSLMCEESAPSTDRTFLYFRGLKLEAIRQGDWKFLLAKGELYNLKEDLGEKTDVAKDHPAICATLSAMIAQVDEDLGVNGVGPGCRPLGRVDQPKPLIEY